MKRWKELARWGSESRENLRGAGSHETSAMNTWLSLYFLCGPSQGTAVLCPSIQSKSTPVLMSILSTCSKVSVTQGSLTSTSTVLVLFRATNHLAARHRIYKNTHLGEVVSYDPFVRS